MNLYTLDKKQDEKTKMKLLYTKMKVFHFKEKIDSLPRDRREILAPIHIRIKPTNACNHNCRYCAYRVEGLQLGKDMAQKDNIPLGKMMEILRDIRDMGIKAVTFSGGGEPFCYPHLLDAVKFLAKTDIKFAVLTNGSRLEEELAKLFARYGTWLRISMDGWDDYSYCFYRKVGKGEFTKIMKNIRNFKRLGGKCYLGVSIIIDKNNAIHIYDLTKRLKGAGVNSVKMSPCIVSNSGKKNNEYHRPIFDAVKREVSRAVKAFADDRFEIFDAYHQLDEKFKKDYNWCPYLQILPVIGADLNIYPCQDKAYNLEEGLIGSIKNKRFKNFWFKDKSKFFEINPSEVCNHHCVANEKNRIISEYLNADMQHSCFV